MLRDLKNVSMSISGLLRQPKWGHLRDLHKAIKLCEDAMVEADGNTTSLGSNAEVKLKWCRLFSLTV